MFIAFVNNHQTFLHSSRTKHKKSKINLFFPLFLPQCMSVHENFLMCFIVPLFSLHQTVKSFHSHPRSSFFSVLIRHSCIHLNLSSVLFSFLFYWIFHLHLIYYSFSSSLFLSLPTLSFVHQSQSLSFIVIHSSFYHVHLLCFTSSSSPLLSILLLFRFRCFSAILYSYSPTPLFFLFYLFIFISFLRFINILFLYCLSFSLVSLSKLILGVNFNLSCEEHTCQIKKKQ